MTLATSFPRVCGDVSPVFWFPILIRQLSPRMRGCFCQLSNVCGSVEAFPAYAGMFLFRPLSKTGDYSFPRVCGDVSVSCLLRLSARRLSPRMRGCFLNCKRGKEAHLAFPAYAGMFPTQSSTPSTLESFPRVCGDVSYRVPDSKTKRRLSPRMRGCFQLPLSSPSISAAFPAYAGMFLLSALVGTATKGFPRVCGDVSRPRNLSRRNLRLSPRMRGCFFKLNWLPPIIVAFPAYAGMFPTHSRSVSQLLCFPRVCGDVSGNRTTDRDLNALSPRMRGCFQDRVCRPRCGMAFPAYAGMFPS